MSTENAIYQAIRTGANTPSKIAKKMKLTDEEVDAELQEFRSRLWVEVDDSGKEPTFTLTNQGERDMRARYPDPD